MRPREIWGPRVCPTCGAEPYVYCKSATGKKASLPHKERYPERPVKVYGEKLQRHQLHVAKTAEKKVREPRTGLPLYRALKEIEEAQMEAFRARNAA